MEVNVDRLRTLRRLRAMSQEELAADSGVGRATGKTLRKLAKALGVDVAELVAVPGGGDA
jgi:transcriptional regulator with XRE-family HTH domain